MATDRSTPDRGTGDHGSSLISTTAGVLVLLVMVLFSAQLLVGLYGRTVVTTTAFDGARRVAGERVDHGDPVAVAAAQDEATSAMRRSLGGVGATATFDWSASTDDEVVLRVQAENPHLMLPVVRRPLVTDHIDRTVRIRVERVR